jgi:hypothetical protein
MITHYKGWKIETRVGWTEATREGAYVQGPHLTEVKRIIRDRETPLDWEDKTTVVRNLSIGHG